MYSEGLHFESAGKIWTVASILSAGIFLLLFPFGCQKTPENIIAHNDYDSLQLAPFVEPDFPFISTSLDLRNLGAGWPSENVVSRGIVLRLGEEAYACFDTDLLRWSVAWTGDFMTLTGMAQISYDDFFNKKNEFPRVLGDPQIATGIYPGWVKGKSEHKDPRERNPAESPYVWGPVSEELGRYDGIYLESDSPILKYSVGQTPVLEKAEAKRFGNQVGFIRSLEIEPHDVDFTLHLAEISDGTAAGEEDGLVVVYHGESKDSVTAAGLISESGEAALQTIDNRFLDAVFTENDRDMRAALVMWKGPADLLSEFRNFVKEQQLSALTPATKNIKKYWPEKVYTSEMRSPDTAALVLDRLMLPVPNPWNRNMRIIDIDFYEDGTAMAVSYEGDIWRIEGIGTEYMTWSRYASGLNEPMSIRILRDTVYVFDRLGIMRFHDRNKDGEADFYENFSNVVPQSMETREWASSLEIDPEGGFYIAKGGALSNGPGIGKPTFKGFRTGSGWDGTVVWISPDGRQKKMIASGLRGPFSGINPKTGMVTVSDQQGNYVPSTPVIHIRQGDYYGVPSTAHGADTSDITPPLLWIPHHVDQSGLGQMWVTSDRMGPLNDQFIHISFGRPGLFKIIIDEKSQPWQGGASYIHGDYPTPVSKGSVNPTDGQAYFAGFNLWGSQSRGISSLLRLRYVEDEIYKMPLSFRAGREGLILEFDEALDADYIRNIGHYQVKRYNYLRTPEYGSGHYRLDGSEGEEQLPVMAAFLSEDGRKLFLNIPNMEPVEQMEVRYELKTAAGESVQDEFWFTLHDAGPIDLEAEGFDGVNEADLVLQEDISSLLDEEDQEISVSRGEDLFRTRACAGCHSSGRETDGFYGPPFQDLYGSTQEFEEGEPRLADAMYIRESILEPDKRIVKGYASEMPSYRGILNDADIESLTLYIKSLSSLGSE